MINDDALAEALRLHSRDNLNTDGGHVIILFADGEIAYTKAGPLYGQRSLHTIVPPKLQNEVYPFPEKHNGYKCVFLAKHKDAVRIRDMM